MRRRPRRARSVPPVATSTPAPSPTNTPEPPLTPVLNIQFVGAPADLSDQRKSSLADLIESVQAGVVQITTDGGSGSGFILTADGWSSPMSMSWPAQAPWASG